MKITKETTDKEIRDFILKCEESNQKPEFWLSRGVFIYGQLEPRHIYGVKVNYRSVV